MSGTYLTYPLVSSGSGLTGSATGVPYFVAPLDGAPANPNGGYIGSNAFYFQSATATFPGLINSTSQTFGGFKTFNQPVILAANGSAAWVAGGHFYDNQAQTYSIFNNVASISLQVGQENWVQVQNNSGATIGNGQAVYITGAVALGDTPTVGLAIANTSSTSALLGVATHDIANGSLGYVTQSGKVHGLNTSAYAAGQRVWLSTASAGFYQVTDPSQPFYSIFVGYVLDVGSTTGSLLLSLIRVGISKPFVNPMTTSGDIIISSGSGNAIRLGIGTQGQSLMVSSGTSVPLWQTLSVATQTQGSISLVNQVVGNLPLSQTQGSLSLTTQVVGVLPAANIPPLSSITGSVSLTSQVSGNLPLSQTQGSLSLVNQVVGNLPLSQTSGSLSLINQVKDYFPSVGIGSVTITQTLSGTAYPWVLPLSQGSASWLLTNNGAGSLSWVAGLTNPMTTSGDIIVGGGSGTATRQPIGSTGSVLTVNGSPVPQWIQPSWSNNLLVNSAFDWWQAFGQVASVAQATSTYVPDQFYVRNVLGGGNIAGVITCSTASGVLDGSFFGCRTQITTAPTGSNNTNGCELWGIVDAPTSVGNIFNQPASFSIQGKALGNVTSVGIQMFYSAVSEQRLTGSSSTLNSELVFTVNSANFTLCSVSNFSTANQNSTGGCIGFRIRINGVSSGNTFDVNNGFVLEQAMLNKGPFCFPWQRKTANQNSELTDCQYFFEKSYAPNTPPGIYVGSLSAGAMIVYGQLFQSATNNQLVAYVNYKVSKRTIASFTTYSILGGVNAKARMYDNNNSTEVIAAPFGPTGIIYAGQGNQSTSVWCINSGSTARNSVWFDGHWTADARIQ